MTLSFSQHLSLLEVHGRSAVHNLGRLSPEAEVPPTPLSARATAEDHLGTLAYWAWSLENPSAHVDECPDQRPPEQYADLLAAITTELDRLARLLASSGPEAPIQYFDRAGTTADVARLLAHQTIVVEHSCALSAGVATLSLAASVAGDGIDHALRHWEAKEASPTRRENIVEIRCTDIDDVWHLALKGEDHFRLVPAAEAAVVVEGVAQEVLWWLHGHATRKGSVTLTGDQGTIHDLWVNLMLAGEEPPKRRRWLW